MARTTGSSAFAKGQLMQAVTAGEGAQRILDSQWVTRGERAHLEDVIRQAERAKELLRNAGVKI